MLQEIKDHYVKRLNELIVIVDRLMASSHRATVTILFAYIYVAFWLYGLESDTVRYITVIKGVERCHTMREIGHDIHVYMLYKL